MGYLVGIDIGGTNTVCGLVDGRGTLVRKVKFPTRAETGADGVIRNIRAAVEALIFDAGINKDQLLGVGAGVPGFVDPSLGQVTFNANLGWENIKFASLLGRQLGVPVRIDNDVRMYVFGEAIIGAGRGYSNVLGITLGTGIAAAMVHDGALYYGREFMAGEIGHVSVEGNDATCNCGLVGCLETVASARGMAKWAIAEIRNGRRSVLETWFRDKGLEHITSEDLSAAYDVGDPLAIDTFTRTGWFLGKSIAHAIALLSPDVVILGGGGALAGERLFKPLREALEHTIHPRPLNNLSIRQAINLDDAGVIGSALYVNQQLGHPCA